ncbi:hypothetical protein INR49_026815 [Caranx melampygus]|nr:hypothetical protein INR49_026815 [Caranx melampygus]
MHRQGYLSTPPSAVGGMLHLVPAQVHVNGHSSIDRETDILDDELPTSQEGNSVDSLGTFSSTDGRATPADLYYQSEPLINGQDHVPYLERSVPEKPLETVQPQIGRTNKPITLTQSDSAPSSVSYMATQNGSMYRSQSFGADPKSMPQAPTRTTSSRDAVQRGLNVWQRFGVPEEPVTEGVTFSPPPSVAAMPSHHSLPQFPHRHSASQQEIEQSIETLNLLMLDLEPGRSQVPKSQSAPLQENSVVVTTQPSFSQSQTRPSYHGDAAIHTHFSGPKSTVANHSSPAQILPGKPSTVDATPVHGSLGYPSEVTGTSLPSQASPAVAGDVHLKPTNTYPPSTLSNSAEVTEPHRSPSAASASPQPRDSEPDEVFNVEGLVAQRVAEYSARAKSVIPSMTSSQSEHRRSHSLSVVQARATSTEEPATLPRHRIASDGHYQNGPDSDPSADVPLRSPVRCVSPEFANAIALNPGGRPKERHMHSYREAFEEMDGGPISPTPTVGGEVLPQTPAFPISPQTPYFNLCKFPLRLTEGTVELRSSRSPPGLAKTPLSALGLKPHNPAEIQLNQTGSEKLVSVTCSSKKLCGVCGEVSSGRWRVVHVTAEPQPPGREHQPAEKSKSLYPNTEPSSVQQQSHPDLTGEKETLPIYQIALVNKLPHFSPSDRPLTESSVSTPSQPTTDSGFRSQATESAYPTPTPSYQAMNTPTSSYLDSSSPASSYLGTTTPTLSYLGPNTLLGAMGPQIQAHPTQNPPKSHSAMEAPQMLPANGFDVGMPGLMPSGSPVLGHRLSQGAQNSPVLSRQASLGQGSQRSPVLSRQPSLGQPLQSSPVLSRQPSVTHPQGSPVLGRHPSVSQVSQRSPSLDRHPMHSGYTTPDERHGNLSRQSSSSGYQGPPTPSFPISPAGYQDGGMMGGGFRQGSPAPGFQPQLPEKRRMSSGDRPNGALSYGTLNGKMVSPVGGGGNQGYFHTLSDFSRFNMPDGSPESRLNVKFVQDTSKFWYKPDISREQGCLSALVYQHAITPLALPCKLLIPTTDLTEEVAEVTTTNPLAERLKQGAVQSPPADFHGKKSVPFYLETYIWNVHSVMQCALHQLRGDGVTDRPTGCCQAISETLAATSPPTATVVHFKVSSQGITLTDNQRNPMHCQHVANAHNTTTYPERTMEVSSRRFEPTWNLLFANASNKCVPAGSHRLPVPWKHFVSATCGGFVFVVCGFFFRRHYPSNTVTFCDIDPQDRKIFFRRHYPSNTVTFCDIDPQDRKWNKPEGGTAKLFGFVARKQGSTTDNVSHLFAEMTLTSPPAPSSTSS